jgi:hypothetical protein
MPPRRGLCRGGFFGTCAPPKPSQSTSLVNRAPPPGWAPGAAAAGRRTRARDVRGAVPRSWGTCGNPVPRATLVKGNPISRACRAPRGAAPSAFAAPALHACPPAGFPVQLLSCGCCRAMGCYVC